jgi:hypothetical protein
MATFSHYTGNGDGAICLPRAEIGYNAIGLPALSLTQPEEIVQKDKKNPPEKEKPAPVANHTEKIKSQVLAKIGKPPRLDRVEVSHHHNGKYRVNIWEQPEPIKNMAVTIGPRIGLSYYLTVSDTGEIIDSIPPMVMFGSHA